MSRVRLAPQELSELVKRNDVRPALHLLGLLAAFVSTFALRARFAESAPVLSWFGAAIVVGALQHHLSIVQHEANHFLLFTSRRINELVGSAVAFSIGFTMDYRTQHLIHHRTLGVDTDPDLPNYRDYPAAPGGFAVDLLASLSGFAAAKQFLWQRAAKSDGPPPARGGLLRIALTQLALLAVFAAVGRPLDYFLLWLLPLVTVAKTLAHFRNVVEHTLIRHKADPELSRYRTIEASWLERFFFCPMHFNLHAEHHIHPAIPFYNLPRAHALMRAKPGYREEIDLDRGYLRFLLTRAVRWSRAAN